jgi:hypothetical protein
MVIQLLPPASKKIVGSSTVKDWPVSLDVSNFKGAHDQTLLVMQIFESKTSFICGTNTSSHSHNRPLSSRQCDNG